MEMCLHIESLKRFVAFNVPAWHNISER